MERNRKDYRHASSGTVSEQASPHLPSYQWHAGEYAQRFFFFFCRKLASF